MAIQFAQYVARKYPYVESNDQRFHEQFVQQQHAADIGQFDVEKQLRSNNESFKPRAHCHPSVIDSGLSMLKGRTFATRLTQISVMVEPGRYPGSMGIHVYIVASLSGLLARQNQGQACDFIHL